MQNGLSPLARLGTLYAFPFTDLSLPRLCQHLAEQKVYLSHNHLHEDIRSEDERRLHQLEQAIVNREVLEHNSVMAHGRLTTANDKLTKANDQLTTANNELNTKNADLKQENYVVKTRNAALSKEKDEINKECNDLWGDYVDLQIEIRKARKDNSDLKRDDCHFKRDNCHLKGDNDELKIANDELERDAIASDRKLSEVTNEYFSMIEDNKKLKFANSNLTTSNAELTKEIDELKNSNGELERMRNRLIVEIAELKNADDKVSINKEINRLMQEVDDISKRNRVLEKALAVVQKVSTGIAKA
jgi:chromosome segregation ATPase